MNYKPTQVYLDPGDHARLKVEAQRRGISLAELIRRLVGGLVGERAPAYGAKSWDAITAVADGDPTEVVAEGDGYWDEAVDGIYEKKMRLARGGSTPSGHRNKTKK